MLLGYTNRINIIIDNKNIKKMKASFFEGITDNRYIYT